MKRLRGVLDDGSLEGPFAELMKDYLELRAPAGSEVGPVLHLNARNQLLQALERAGSGSLSFAPALQLIMQSARFFAGKAMSAAESRESFAEAMQSLASLVALAERPSGPGGP